MGLVEVCSAPKTVPGTQSLRNGGMHSDSRREGSRQVGRREREAEVAG